MIAAINAVILFSGFPIQIRWNSLLGYLVYVACDPGTLHHPPSRLKYNVKIQILKNQDLKIYVFRTIRISKLWDIPYIS